jgi:transcriptional regulator with XRE-family HTH domain
MKVKLRSKKVRELLARKNLSQNWLAGRIGASSSYISQVMNGVRNPSPRMREAIMQVFKDSKFDELFSIKS